MARRRRKPPVYGGHSDIQTSGGGYTPKKHKPPKPPSPGISDVRSSGPGGYNHPHQPKPSTYGGTSDVQSSGPHGYNNPPAWVVQRQRLLRAHGYNVTVDGYWGHRAQQAWRAYTGAKLAQTVARGAGADIARVRALQVSHGFAGHGMTGLTPADARKAGKKVTDILTQFKKEDVAAKIQKYKAAAAVIRKKPVSKLTVHDVVALTIDPLTGKFNPEHPGDVRLMQKFLRLHGHPKLAVDGLFGKTTFHALVDQYKVAQKFEQAAMVRRAEGLFFNTGLLKKGQKPPEGFPLDHVPAAGELTKLVHQGGFTAELVMRWVTQKLREDDPAFRQVSMNFVQKITHKNDPFTSAFLRYSPAQLIGKYGYAAGAYMHSGSARELRVALAEAERKDDRAYRAQQLREHPFHTDGGGFFGDLINVVSWPGEYLRDTAVGFLHEAMGQLGGYGTGPRRGPLFSPTGLPAFATAFPTSAESSREIGSRILDRFAKDHPWWSIAFALVADPLNYVTPKMFLLPAIGVYKGGLVLEKAGFTLAESGRIGRLPVVLTVPARTSRHLWDSVDHLTADAARGLEALAHLQPYERHGIEHFLVGAYRTYKHSTQLKQWIITASRRENGLAGLRMWKKAKAGQEASFGKVEGRMARETNLETGEFEPKLAASMLDLGPRVELRVAPLFDGLRDERVSLVARIGGGLTRVGTQLRARLFEEVRLRAAHVTAYDEAGKYALMRLSGRTSAVSRDPETGQMALDLGHTLTPAEDAFYKEQFAIGYKESLKKAGSHFQGGKDAEFNKKFAFLRQVGQRDAHSFIIALQHQLELHWETAGNPLFDENGAWKGLGGEFTEMFKTWATEHFDGPLVPVDNPNYNLWFHKDEYLAAGQEEIDRMTGIFDARTDMLRENGEFVDEAYVARRHAEIESDVWGHWREDRKTGLFTDDRAKVQVPAAHARIRRDVGGAGDKRISSDTIVGEQELQPARGFLPGPVESSQASQIDQLLREVGGSFFPGGGKAVRVLQRGGILHEHDLRDLRASLAHFTKVRLAAEEYVLPQILYRNGLVLEAMRLAQRRPLRIIYKAFNGATQIWKFSTLALRPGWVIRNVADNTIKSVLEGVRDPRHYLPTQQFAQGQLYEAKTVFDVGIGPLRDSLEYLDRMFGTNATVYFDKAMEVFWSTMDAGVIQKLFTLQGVAVPRKVIEGEYGRGSFGGFYGPERLEEGARITTKVVEPGVADEMIALQDKIRAAENRVHALHGGPADPLDVQGFGGDWKAFSRSRGYTESEIRDFQRWKDLHERHPGLEPDIYEGGMQYASAGNIRGHLGRFAEDQTTTVVKPPSYYNKAVRFLWHISGEAPEQYSRKVLYRSIYAKTLRDTGDEMKAYEAGRDAVEKVLFDYSKVTAIEDNLKLFFPFIQFWRKNTSLWIRNFIDHPAFLAGVLRYEGQMDKSNIDEPDWMRRYVNMEGLGDVVAKVPGLSFLTSAFNDFQTDPLNFMSFSPLYRAFKQENPTLPAERAGMPFIGALLDGFSQWGLGINPFLRKPLEVAGVVDLRTWQHIFPQTDLVQIFTKAFWADKFRGTPGLDLEAILLDPLYEAIGLKGVGQVSQENYNQLVQREMAGQFARGETVSRAKAEAQTDGFLQVHTLVGYFAGLYGRRNTPEDLYLYQLTEQVRKGQHPEMTNKQWDEYNLWAQRKADPLAFDAYVEAIPLIQAYYNFSTWTEKQDWLKANPEISGYVNKSVRYKLPGPEFARTVALVRDTQVAMEITHFLQDEDAPFELRKRMESALITPSLRKFWLRNDTPRKTRDKMLKAEFYRHVLGLQKTYFSISETDFDARSGYLDQHPELAHFWLMNNSNSDDYKAIIDTSNAALREHYFNLVDEGGFDAGADFLHRFPFMFEFTSAASKVDPETGEWLNSGGRGGGRRFGFSHGLTEHARDYLAVKSLLDWFFNLPKAQQSDWLYGKSPGAKRVRDYFAKWSGGGNGNSQHAKDFLAAKKYLDYFFNLLDSDKSAAYDWLDGKSAGAKAVRAYFKKYASKGPKSEHAKDFLAVKKYLDFFFALDSDKQREWLQGNSKGAKLVRAYFDKWAGKGPGKQAQDYRRVKKQLKYYYSLDKTEAHDWLHSDDPRAVSVLAYFNRWSKLNQLSRKWGDYLQSLDPELNSRLRFWQKYWLLPPDLRPAFVMNHAQEAGVYVFGGAAQDELFRRESEDARQAVVHTHLSLRNVAYIRMRPYLELLASLEGSDRRFFLRANPDLQHYLDKYGGGSITGNKHLDKLIERYFKLPSDSPARSVFLRVHPEVQRYFDKRNPADAPIHRLLEVYFRIPIGERPDFVLHHPEIPAYFDQRRLEADNQRAVLDLFGSADPRLAAYRAAAKKKEQELLDRLKHQQDAARLRAMRALELERRTRY